MRAQRIPWARLLAEGCAIVVSILLAFAIDAGWDERQERNEERRVLSALMQEFERNREEAVEVLAVHELAAERFTRFASMSPDEILRLPPDSVTLLAASLALPRTFDAVRGTVDALIGAGKLGILQDPALREAISAFLNIVEDSQEDVSYLSQYSVRTWEALQKYGWPWRVPRTVKRQGQPGFLTEPSAAMLAQARADGEVMGLARQTAWLGWVYAGEVELILEQVERVVSLAGSRLE